MTLIVTGGCLSLILPFLVIPLIAVLLFGVPDNRPPTWLTYSIRASIPIGATLLVAGIALGLWQGIRNRGQIS